MTTRFSRWSALSSLIPLLTIADPARAAAIDDALPNVRRSLGLDRLAPGQALHLTGTARFFGSDATFDALFDAEGRSVISYAGPVTQITGFDGETAWTTDLGGETRVEQLGDRESAIATAGILSGLWFIERSAARFALDETRTTDALVTLTFENDQGRFTGDVEIDRATWRPVK
jgi:hypothetical protein